MKRTITKLAAALTVASAGARWTATAAQPMPTDIAGAPNSNPVRDYPVPWPTGLQIQRWTQLRYAR